MEVKTWTGELSATLSYKHSWRSRSAVKCVSLKTVHHQSLNHTGSPGASGPLPQRGSSVRSDKAAQDFIQLNYKIPSDGDHPTSSGPGAHQTVLVGKKKSFSLSLSWASGIFVLLSLKPQDTLLWRAQLYLLHPSQWCWGCCCMPRSHPCSQLNQCQCQSLYSQAKDSSLIATPQHLPLIFSAFLKY